MSYELVGAEDGYLVGDDDDMMDAISGQDWWSSGAEGFPDDFPAAFALAGDDPYLVGYQLAAAGWDSDIIGADDDDLGALLAAAGAARGKKRLHPALAMMMRKAVQAKKLQSMRAKMRGMRGGRPLAGHVGQLRKVAPTKLREFSIGFNSTGNVVAGTTADITGRPQVPFRGRRLVVPSNIAGFFTIVDVKVGKNSQFVAAGAQHALVFSELGFGVDLHTDTAVPGIDLTLTVNNIGGADLPFRAVLIGRAVE